MVLFVGEKPEVGDVIDRRKTHFLGQKAERSGYVRRIEEKNDVRGEILDRPLKRRLVDDLLEEGAPPVQFFTEIRLQPADDVILDGHVLIAVPARQHPNLLAPFFQRLDDVPAAEVIPCKGIGGVESVNDQDAHGGILTTRQISPSIYTPRPP